MCHQIPQKLYNKSSKLNVAFFQKKESTNQPQVQTLNSLISQSDLELEAVGVYFKHSALLS